MQLGSSSLTANAVQTITPVLTAPSPTNTMTRSASATLSVTPSLTSTPSSSASNTITGSPSASIGASSSSSLTSTSSVSATASASLSPTATVTPQSTLPYKVRISNYNWMHFYELLAFSNTGKLLSLVGLGAKFNTSTLYGTQFPYYGGDLCISPVQGECGTLYTHTNDGKGFLNWWEMTFPGGTTGATAVSTIYLSNRLTPGIQCDGTGTPGCEARMIGANLTVTSPAGTTNFQAINLTASAVQTFQVGPYNGPFYPDPADAFQVDENNRRLKVRYVLVRSAPSATACLHFRELMVLDTTYTKWVAHPPVMCSLCGMQYPTVLIDLALRSNSSQA